MQIDTRKDDILTAIAKLGGIDMTEAEAHGTDPAEFKVRVGRNNPFRRNGGNTIDGIGERLSELGFVSPDYTANEVLDKISRALKGEKIYTPEGYEAQAERDYLERMEDMAEMEAAEGVDYPVDITNDEIVLAHWVEQAMDVGISMEDMTNATSKDTTSDIIAGIKEAIANEQARQTEYEASQESSASNQAGTFERQALAIETESDSRKPDPELVEFYFERPVDDNGDVIFGDSALILTSYSESDLASQAEYQDQANKTKQKEEKAAEDKAKADAEANDFVLTGSDRPTDVAEARGQNSLFGPTTLGEAKKAEAEPKSKSTPTGRPFTGSWAILLACSWR